MSDLTDLQELIEKLRLELHGMSMGRVLTDPEVIKVSGKLDLLLVEYQNFAAC
ncbi:MAG: Sporulation stage 0, Spo0E-like regulatory phosphatase [Firmicutes bacterium]|nr:Sporulation stage 0, Spo0E-like regulatory phosphatase [Bacillota bacterium]